MDDVLLVWKMNGEPLTRRTAIALRAIVPGWYRGFDQMAPATSS